MIHDAVRTYEEERSVYLGMQIYELHWSLAQAKLDVIMKPWGQLHDQAPSRHQDPCQRPPGTGLRFAYTLSWVTCGL